MASDVIAELGELHYGRRKVQPTSAAMQDFHERSREVLQFQLLEFSPEEVDAIGAAFSESVGEERYTCYACAIMPDHVHILIRKHKHKAEQMIQVLQESSRLQLRTGGSATSIIRYGAAPAGRSFSTIPTRSDGRSGISKGTRSSVVSRRSIGPFVTEYDGWPLHPGHNPNSPYARRLRNYRRE
jgi:REP element-mobilizing transposase RayT